VISSLFPASLLPFGSAKVQPFFYSASPRTKVFYSFSDLRLLAFSTPIAVAFFPRPPAALGVQRYGNQFRFCKGQRKVF
ncbi:hypothetical protein WG947_16795, partial [Pontibacter sp. H259]|uniref:hypothetical protein n=1 Tax=Pontibacter sp. H259 TaxID=3133421 RepID=UPI0030BE1358